MKYFEKIALKADTMLNYMKKTKLVTPEHLDLLSILKETPEGTNFIRRQALDVAKQRQIKKLYNKNMDLITKARSLIIKF
jgi:hypothetical protein